jgi:uncharacterized repeat protein (TIGR01451 family)
MGEEQRWGIGVRVLSSDPYGLSELPGPQVLNDVVSAKPGANVWLLSCAKVVSLFSWPTQVGSAPAPPTQLVAPTPTCSQLPKPNGNISASLAGIDYSRVSAPPSPGLLGYFELDTWVSDNDITKAGGTVDVCDAVETTDAGMDTGNGWSPIANTTFGTWHPVDVSGNRNLLGGTEPIGNNGACLAATIPVPTPGAAAFNKTGVVPTVNGDGVLKSATTTSQLWFYNVSSSPMTKPGEYVCDKWDDSRFFPTGLSQSATPSWSPSPMVIVEYGLGGWGSNSTLPDPQKWAAQASNNCSASSVTITGSSGPIPLSSLSTFKIPPGVKANFLRITFPNDPLPGGEFITININWNMLPTVVPGDELRNYSAAFDSTSGQWGTSTCVCVSLVKGQSAGYGSHWWTTIAGTVEVLKSRPDSAKYAPGGTVPWTISARGVAPVGGVAGSTTDVKVVDTLPPGFTYVPGSTTGGTGEPTCTTTSPQVCTWSLGNLPWSSVPTVSFTFQTAVSVFEPSGTYTNTARGQTPDDPSPYGPPATDRRVSAKDVDIIQSSGAAIDKSVSPASPAPNSPVTYTLRYGNPSSSSVMSMNAIDILPYVGDPRGSQFAPGTFTLTGISPSAKVPQEEIWVTDANPAALDAIDGADGYLDPTAPGVGAVPSSQWPCKVSPATGLLTDAIGGLCPFSVAQVTALRIIGTGTTAQPFLPAVSGPFPITLTYHLGNCVEGSKFANSWLARFTGLLPLRFPAQTAAASGCPSAAVTPAGGTPTVVTPAGSTPAAVTPGTGAAPARRHGAGGLALTGAGLARLTVLALSTVVFGVALAVACRRPRRRRRADFAAWLEAASADDLIALTRDPGPGR